MTHFESLVSQVLNGTGVKIIGLMRMVGRIKNGIGTDASDVLGFDYVLKDESGTCLEFYAANPPLIGMSHPVPIPCPLGILAFNGYKISYQEAIAIFKKEGGEQFAAVSLSWPLTHPETSEPFWHIRSSLGVDFIVGAISGQTGKDGGNLKYFGPIVVKYMGPVVKYMGPQS